MKKIAKDLLMPPVLIFPYLQYTKSAANQQQITTNPENYFPSLIPYGSSCSNNQDQSSPDRRAGLFPVDLKRIEMKQEDCPFCHLTRDVIQESEHCFAIYDKYPVNTGHVLVVSNRHAADYFDLGEDETAGLWRLVAEMRSFLMEEYLKMRQSTNE
jgi:hypothetical protein